jgi:hypothetical protein
MKNCTLSPAERVVVLRLRQVHVVVVVGGVLLMVAEHGVDHHATGERIHVGKVVLGPVLLVGAGGHKVAAEQGELRTKLPHRLSNPLDDLRLRLAVADHREGNRGIGAGSRLESSQVGWQRDRFIRVWRLTLWGRERAVVVEHVRLQVL